MSQENFQILNPNEEIKLSSENKAPTVTPEPVNHQEPAKTGELILKLIIEEEYESR